MMRPFALPILRKQQLRMHVTNEQVFSNEKNRDRKINKCPHRSSLVRQLAFKSCMHVRPPRSVFLINLDQVVTETFAIFFFAERRKIVDLKNSIWVYLDLANCLIMLCCVV